MGARRVPGSTPIVGKGNLFQYGKELDNVRVLVGGVNFEKSIVKVPLTSISN